MSDFIEKRDYPRMILESSARYTEEGATQPIETTIKDLSSSGMLLVNRTPIDIDACIQVTITPLIEVTPPLIADVKVLRCDPLEAGPGEPPSYAIACLVERFHDRQPQSAASF
ncbi:MAG: PilZ domain-containing protein [bacterium]